MNSQLIRNVFVSLVVMATALFVTDRMRSSAIANGYTINGGVCVSEDICADEPCSVFFTATTGPQGALRCWARSCGGSEHEVTVEFCNSTDGQLACDVTPVWKDA